MNLLFLHSKLYQKNKKHRNRLFLCIIFAGYYCMGWGQLEVKIGNDTTFCAGNIGEGIQLAPNLSVRGGTAPYQYCWSISKPYEYLQGRWSYASSMLNDTTIANPTIVQYTNDPPFWAQFILNVEDKYGNKASDSINVRFSEYKAYTLGEFPININLGDSIFFDISGMDFGGILPYNYIWSPQEGLTNPELPQTWCKPDKESRYHCILTDSVGCVGYTPNIWIIVNGTSIPLVQNQGKVYQSGAAIFFDNLNNQEVLLQFYDLSGNLVQEGLTSSNSYNPGFTVKGTILFCKIKFNNKQTTIKYIVP